MAEHPIYDFNAKPKNTAQVWKEKLKEHTLLFGVEVETEVFDLNKVRKPEYTDRQFVASKCKDIMGKKYVYAKHDGSIGNGGRYGFEVVTHPFSWSDYHTTRVKWDTMFEWLRDIGWCSSRIPEGANSNGCGVHVHMSKGAFTSFHLYKFLEFMYASKNRSFLNIIARRPPNQYCDYFAADKKGIKGIAKEKLNSKHDGNRRHAAVSLMYKPTVELRIFRGTLDPHLFHMTLEFCHALYYYTKVASAKDLSVATFINYLVTHPTWYENLIVFLKNSSQFKKAYKRPHSNLMKGI
jgi:hypothetical protein